MNFDFNTILASAIWGSVGIGCIVYGKKQAETVPMVAGFALLAVSYFIPSALGMSAISVGLIGVMVWLTRQGY